MAVLIKNSRDIAQSGIKVLVYGQPGVGKTRLCATAPSPVILSAESGLLSVQGEGLDYIEIRNVNDLMEAYEWLRSSTEAKAYQTVCLDSISEIAEQLLSDEKRKVKDGRMAYAQLNDRMASLLRAFRDLPDKHVYFSAKMEMAQGNDGIIINRPSLPGKTLTQNIGYYFDEEFAFVIQKDTDGKLIRKLQTSKDTVYEAKDRSGVLDMFEEPDLREIFRKMEARNG